MNIARYLCEQSIKIEMTSKINPPEEGASISKWKLKSKEIILDELVSVLECGFRVGNRTKLLADFVNREKKASTGIGHGIAIPHIRSMQAKDFMLGFARSTGGYEFDSPDNQPAHLFFVMAAPPYDDNLYLKIFKSLSEVLHHHDSRTQLLEAESAGEIIRIIRNAV